MSTIALQALVGAALIDPQFCEELLGGGQIALLSKFGLTIQEREAISAIKANSAPELAIRLKQLANEAKQPHEEHPTFLIECLAQGWLWAYDVQAPPVPVREMVERPLHILGHLTLLKLSLGLYDVAYRPGLNGSRMIVVDPTRPDSIQRTGIARELYVAFCRSPRAAELDWPNRDRPYVHSEFFARCLLTPKNWVLSAQIDNISMESMAARFGVSEQAMAQRLGEINHNSPQTSLSEQVAEALFALEDPWRSRFFSFVASQATDKTGDKQLPTQKQVVTWLRENPSLHQDVRYMLNTWQKPGKRLAYC